MWYPPGWEPEGWQPPGWTPDSAAPLFVGPIPNVSRALSSGDYTVDLSEYFAGAVAYSIEPAVPEGWSFDTETGVLTIGTDTAGEFGPFKVKATNEHGEAESNEFTVMVVANVLAYVIELDGLIPSAGRTERLIAQTFAVQAGTYLEIRVPVVNSDGEAVSLEGCSARFVAGPLGEADKLALNIVGSIAGSTITFAIPDEQNEELAGAFRFEAWVKDAADRDIPVALGIVGFKRSRRLVA